MSDADPKPSKDAPKEAQAEQTEEKKQADAGASKASDKPEEKKKEKRTFRIKKEGENNEPTPENEIRVAANGQIKKYLGYAFLILKKDYRSVTIRATGNAIVKALILIELVKRRYGELHQINKIYSKQIVAVQEIEGMDKVENRMIVTAMDTILSKDQLDVNDPGYQKHPDPEDQVIPAVKPEQTKKDGRKKQKKQYNAFVHPGKEEKKERRDKKQDKNEDN